MRRVCAFSLRAGCRCPVCRIAAASAADDPEGACPEEWEPAAATSAAAVRATPATAAAEQVTA